MTTANQMIEAAAEKIGVKESESDLESGDYQVILNEMNDMGVAWADIGLTPAYVEVSDRDDIVNIDASARSAFKNNLAILIAPSFERIVSAALAAVAKSSLDTLRASVTYIGEVAYPDTLPTGSGNDCGDTFRNDRFFDQNKTENF